MIEWIKENGEHVVAAVGALYALARVVVALTPTPKDDAALSKVAAPLRALGKVFGLDLKQGLESKDKTSA